MGNVEIKICFLYQWGYSDFYFSDMLIEKIYVLYSFCINQYIWLVARATKRVKLLKKIKDIFSETIREMEIILRIHVNDISLYINCGFVSISYKLWLLWHLFFIVVVIPGQ